MQSTLLDLECEIGELLARKESLEGLRSFLEDLVKEVATYRQTGYKVVPTEYLEPRLMGCFELLRTTLEGLDTGIEQLNSTVSGSLKECEEVISNVV